MDNEFDSVAETYSAWKMKQWVQRHAVYWSFHKLIGEARGQTVLDLGCGDGIVGRQLLKRSALRIDAVDQSKKMLQIADSKHTNGPLMRYHQRRVGELCAIGNYKIITGAYLLPCARTREQLFAMCRDIEQNLAPDGTFYGITTHSQKALERDPSLRDGDRIECKITVEGEVKLTFSNYYWSRETYEEEFAEAELNVEWVEIAASPKGKAIIGAKNAAAEVARTRVILLKCTRM
jgi:toxoflavin synthase